MRSKRVLDLLVSYLSCALDRKRERLEDDLEQTLEPELEPAYVR